MAVDKKHSLWTPHRNIKKYFFICKHIPHLVHFYANLAKNDLKSVMLIISLCVSGVWREMI